MIQIRAREKRELHKQPKALVNRYWRLWAYKKQSAWLKRIARRIARRRMIKSEKPRMEALRATLDTVANETARARRHGFEAMTTVLNLSLFFLIAERDIQELKVDALTHPDAWRRSLCSRVILLTIHELDMDKVAGGKLRLALEDAKIPKPLAQRVRNALEEVRLLQKKAQSEFSQLRNSTIAHRDADALKQYRDIRLIEPLEIGRVAAEFYSGIHELTSALLELISHMGSMKSILGQWMSAERRRSKSAAATRNLHS
jgi:hypothetical protein